MPAVVVEHRDVISRSIAAALNVELIARLIDADPDVFTGLAERQSTGALVERHAAGSQREVPRPSQGLRPRRQRKMPAQA
jgi:hypothetical protein